MSGCLARAGGDSHILSPPIPPILSRYEMIRKPVIALFASVTLGIGMLAAQEPADRNNNPGPFPMRAGNTTYPAPGARGSSNIKVLAHVPDGGFLHVSDIELEQELSRP